MPVWRRQPSPGAGALEYSSRQPSATACLMLSAEPRAGRGAGAVAARGADLGEVGAALRRFGVPLHRRVCGAELLDLHRDVAEPAVDLRQARTSGSAPGRVGSPRAPPPRDPGHRRNPVPWTTVATSLSSSGRGGSSSCRDAVQQQHRPGQVVDVGVVRWSVMSPAAPPRSRPAAAGSPRPRRATSRWPRWCRPRVRSGRSCPA